MRGHLPVKERIKLSVPPIAMRLHTNTQGEVLAAADTELVGQTLKDGKITFHVSKLFYQEKLVSEEEFIELLSQVGNINLIGERVIRVAANQKLVPPNEGIRIAGVPHAQIYKI